MRFGHGTIARPVVGHHSNILRMMSHRYSEEARFSLKQSSKDDCRRPLLAFGIIKQKNTGPVPSSLVLFVFGLVLGVHGILKSRSATIIRRTTIDYYPQNLEKLSRGETENLLIATSATIIRKTTAASYPPKLENLPYGETDNLLIGKSCIYNAPANHLSRLVYLLLRKNPWKCQECNPEISTTYSGGQLQHICKPLEPRGKCAAFQRTEPDAKIPRVASSHSPFTREKSSTRTYHHNAHSEYALHDVADCGGTLSLPCFNVSRCSGAESGGAVKVFPYGKEVEAQLDFAIQQNSNNQHIMINKTSNAEEACIFVVGPHSFEKPFQLQQQKEWNHGQNHYIWYSAQQFGTHGDRPFNTIFNYEMAATSPWSMDDAYNREGYDTPIGLYPKWIRPTNYDNLDIHRQRRLLLAFKGNIYPWEQPSWQHRWIAAEYWHSENDDVFVDVKCRKFIRVHGYADTSDSAYEELLLNSTFFFCPGGGSTNSYRFPESLQAGAIPVVTSDFLAPFHPEIDWSGCIVRVSEVRVVDIPNIVRSTPDEEVQMRQRNCAKLLEKVYGNPPDINQHFSTAMQIWAIRIKNALRTKSELSGLMV